MYFVLEGLDGASKTSTIRELITYYPEAQVVREPGGTSFGEGIRNLVLSGQTVDNRLTKEEELTAMCLSRSSLQNKIIKPVLAQGGMIISDRGEASTYVYQAVNDELREKLHDINQVLSIIPPDFVVFIDITYPTYVARMRGRGVEHELFDVMDAEEFDARRARYMAYLATLNDAYLIIESNSITTPASVAGVISSAIELRTAGKDIPTEDTRIVDGVSPGWLKDIMLLSDPHQ